jgi:hypothetical protein
MAGGDEIDPSIEEGLARFFRSRVARVKSFGPFVAGGKRVCATLRVK